MKAGEKMSDEQKAKISAAHLGVSLSPEHRASISKASLGRVKSPETRAKMSASRTGKPLSLETRSRISSSNLGKPKSAAHRAALKEAWVGRKPSDAQIAAITAARSIPRTPESLARQAASLSKTMKGRARTPAQIAVFKRATAKAHAAMLGNPYGRFRGSFSRVGFILRERDGDRCQLCLKVIDFSLPVRTPMSRSVDHVTPARAGGADSLDNLWLSHLVCNQRKGARHVGRPDGTTDVR